mmetsp:Transcript_9462/g.20965  ORF Transcript_9462/g.20965 Transcript_9462/m.20965 type:complete len:94 (-) Transcript_9462:526-807(-)
MMSLAAATKTALSKIRKDTESRKGAEFTSLRNPWQRWAHFRESEVLQELPCKDSVCRGTFPKDSRNPAILTFMVRFVALAKESFKDPTKPTFT